MANGYDSLFSCPFCKTDSAGNHQYGCRMNTNNLYIKLKDPAPVINYSDNTYDDDLLLYKLKHSGQRLKELLNITDEDIDKAIKQIRMENL